MPAPSGFSPAVPSGGFKQWFNDLWDAVGDILTRTSRLETSLPSGVLWMWAGPSVPAEGWLICDGAAVSRSDYAALFAAIGTTYGVGNGTTTFNLPNLVDRFPRGESVPGGTGGNATHSHALTQAAADIRVFTSGTTICTRNRSTDTRTMDRSFAVTSQQGATTFESSAGTAITGDTDAASTLPPYLDVRFIIKT